MKKTGKYNFLKIENIKISNFSLYSKNSQITQINEKINNGVYCLAGANGLGKTTFLNIINYALTGIVLEPKKDVYSPEDIISSNKDYTTRYFYGRIHSSSIDKAEIEITFKLNEKIFKINRGFSSREILNSLEVYKEVDGKKQTLIDSKDLSPQQLEAEYRKAIIAEMGIGKFEYFIFYQLYVLTFDENRRMIFWDGRASTNTLSIAFNDDLKDTDRILGLKKEMDTLESYGRNTRWQATQIKKEKEALIASQKQKELVNWDDLKKRYDKLVNSIDKKEKLLENVTIEYDTLLKRQNIINSELLQHRVSYKKLFSLYSEPRSKIIDNPYIKFSKNKHECFLCGAGGLHIIEQIEKNIHKKNCPVCNTTINEGDSTEESELLEKLEKLDKTIHSKNEQLDKIIVETEAKEVELEKIDYDYNSIKEKLEKFEADNTDLRFDETNDVPLSKLIKEYQKRYEEADKKAKEFYKQRDKLKPEYDNLIDKISKAYDDAEKYFVPLFKKIARSFIGLDLNIFFRRKSRDISLNFELLGTARTESTQLSESQRFFLDIALRMAIAIYLSKKENEATLLIDTPEGSLDIAYESRVGKMFANFVTLYSQNLIMTANINASQLLLSLAEQCGKENMEFKRMLDWTDLTEIQREGEHLFEKVYKNIEKALKKSI